MTRNNINPLAQVVDYLSELRAALRQEWVHATTESRRSDIEAQEHTVSVCLQILVEHQQTHRIKRGRVA